MGSNCILWNSKYTQKIKTFSIHYLHYLYKIIGLEYRNKNSFFVFNFLYRTVCILYTIPNKICFVDTLPIYTILNTWWSALKQIFDATEVFIHIRNISANFSLLLCFFFIFFCCFFYHKFWYASNEEHM